MLKFRRIKKFQADQTLVLGNQTLWGYKYPMYLRKIKRGIYKILENILERVLLF